MYICVYAVHICRGIPHTLLESFVICFVLSTVTSIIMQMNMQISPKFQGCMWGLLEWALTYHPHKCIPGFAMAIPNPVYHILLYTTHTYTYIHVHSCTRLLYRTKRCVFIQ